LTASLSNSFKFAMVSLIPVKTITSSAIGLSSFL
jgi:hypothetical protein